MTEPQEVAVGPGLFECLIQANPHRKSTTPCLGPPPPSRWRRKSGLGREQEKWDSGGNCEYLLDYNAVGHYIILQRALNKVIMGEVIFVIKLAVTLGHKSWVLGLKKLLNMPPLPHTVLLLNTLILLQILHWLRWGKYTQWANDSFRPRQQPRQHLGLPEWFPEVWCYLWRAFSIKKANSIPSDLGAFASLLLLLIDSSSGRAWAAGC